MPCEVFHDYKKKKNGTHVCVYMDKSFIHTNHSIRKGFYKEDQRANRSNSKGRRLVILHAITRDGPLCSINKTGHPVDTCEWGETGKETDTPHTTEPPPPDLLTAELLWVAHSYCGDYHNNMNPELFIKWTKKRLVPTFKKLYPGKEMILILNNAPYHHKRGIPSLTGLPKKDLISLIADSMGDRDKHLLLPFSEDTQNSK